MSRIVIDMRAMPPVERTAAVKAAVKAAVEPRNASVRAKMKTAVLEQVGKWKDRPGRG